MEPRPQLALTQPAATATRGELALRHAPTRERGGAEWVPRQPRRELTSTTGAAGTGAESSLRHGLRGVWKPYEC